MNMRALLLVFLVVTAGCTQTTEPPEAQPRPTPGDFQIRPVVEVGEPYAYSEPAPPEDPTPIDGRYSRTISVEQAGGIPIFCQRCAPWRLDAGDATLRLEGGRFYTSFEPIAQDRPCPTCRMPPGFSATGHYRVEGDRLEIFNDPNCADMTGVYRWSLRGERLVLKVVEDRCPFVRLRAKYLTAAPWENA
jgi:hypothetical protein